MASFGYLAFFKSLIIFKTHLILFIILAAIVIIFVYMQLILFDYFWIYQILNLIKLLFFAGYFIVFSFVN